MKRSLTMQPCPRLSFKVICQLTLEMTNSVDFLTWCGSAWKTLVVLSCKVPDSNGLTSV